MKIEEVAYPKESLLFQKNKDYDYVDSFRGTIVDKQNKITPLDLLKAFFSSGPKWISNLFALRNKIVALFGLKISTNVTDKEQLIASLKGVPNEQIGLFKVFESNQNEILIGEDDKHLNFRVSLLLKSLENDAFSKEIYITTTVIYHNNFGRLYFLPVKIFHKKIVPSMLKSIIAEIKNEVII
ncbi:DUF2867 domain-containing protein [Flavobacterium sp. J27]|uniref:DUF2867 domain-containing protein n=1 Tax=Flavobacterium sp. J27 TaxID=2060419 RepID=UPI001030B0DD|nr:DUF2867 domain-containing protein [Flavobacterium sp. J27]